MQATVTLVQALGDAGITVPLWCATSESVAVAATDTIPESAVAAAGLWGLGRVVRLEARDRWGGLVDLPGALDEQARRRLAAVLAGAEDECAVRANGTFAARLVRAADAPRRAWRPRGTVLVTGGTGALGAQVAQRLAERGARHLLLVSRRGPAADGAAELVSAIEATGATATVAACDVADPEAVAALLARVPRRRSAVRRRPHGGRPLRRPAGHAHPGTAHRRTPGQGRCRPRPAHRDGRARPGRVRAVLLARGHPRQPRTGRLRRRQRRPRHARRAPPDPRTARHRRRLGPLGRRWHARRGRRGAVAPRRCHPRSTPVTPWSPWSVPWPPPTRTASSPTPTGPA